MMLHDAHQTDLVDGTFGKATGQAATRQIQFHARVQF